RRRMGGGGRAPMSPFWTLGRRIGAGFAMSVTGAVVIAGLSILAIREVGRAKDRALEIHAEALVGVERLEALLERKIATDRAYQITRDERFLRELEIVRRDFTAQLDEIRKR